jgi:hypothetical protein
MNAIEIYFTCEKKPVIGRPDHDNKESWVDLWTCLIAAEKAIDTFLDDTWEKSLTR